jgi:alkylated DNA repair protein (DNA oxidative demethylase)
MTRPEPHPATLSLFDEEVAAVPAGVESLATQAFVLRGFADGAAFTLLKDLRAVEALAPFRHMQTPGGFAMSVALTNCGRLGWTTDQRGYRYSELDPLTARPWPPMPESFLALARSAAASAGFPDFEPDACLVNRYLPDSRLTLHQDKNERTFDAPIVSVSLGIPATFLFGGFERNDRAARILLRHGDVVVWGGVDRLRFHGVLPLKHGLHTTVGEQRFNFTLRRAG